MLRKGVLSQASDAVTPGEEIKNPYVLEFFGLKDEYSETELEDALIRKLTHADAGQMHLYLNFAREH